jgi:Uri superfamily endonuclease
MRLTTIPTEPGTYALVLASQKTGPVRIGRLGTLDLRPGVYIYVGSAFGPGGLAARIRHHAKIATRPHWHIDYLRAVCDLVEVWFTTEAACREHAWAGAVARLPGAVVPMPGFGSSDCQCAAHLFWFEHAPSIKRFQKLVKHPVGVAGGDPWSDKRQSRLQGRKPVRLC